MMRATAHEFSVQPASGESWEPPFLGRKVELSRLRDCFARRESLLIAGPAGVGKTALVMEVLKDLPPAVARSTISLSRVEGLQPLLRTLLCRFYKVRDSTLHSQLHAEGVREGTFRAWLNSLHTSRLKGAAYRSAENGQYRIVLDHTPPLTHAVTKVVKELVQMRGTPVLLLARGPSESQLGRAADLYWSDCQHLGLGPPPDRALRELLEWCICRFSLARLNLAGFREDMIRLSGGIPGALIKMCALAAEPRYQFGSQVKTKLVHIDSLLGGYKPMPLQQPSERSHDGR
jgi:hypothetical protein